MIRATALFLGMVIATCPAAAHFQEIIPSVDVLPEGGAVTLDLVFTHPMSGGPAMAMARPARFGMMRGGRVVDLSGTLAEKPADVRNAADAEMPVDARKPADAEPTAPNAIGGATAWTATVDLAEPGAAVFFIEPQPYWEPAEGKSIVHYAKVVVDSWASGEGWDAMVGLPVEIEPLVRPTGLWTGNLFTGIVRKDGAPVPFAEIEVEYVNDGSVTAPNDAFLTQVIKADQNGVFSYAMPRAGWWGFAALMDGDAPMAGPDGKPAPVELGALIFVKTTDMK